VLAAEAGFSWLHLRAWSPWNQCMRWHSTEQYLQEGRNGLARSVHTAADGEAVPHMQGHAGALSS
jgi:hypothetical protein